MHRPQCKKTAVQKDRSAKRPQCKKTAVQYTDIALAAVLCSIAQVPVAKTTTTPHLIGGKTLHRSLEFFYNLTCKGRLWAITSPIRIMFTSSQWRSKKLTRVATTLVYICDPVCEKGSYSLSNYPCLANHNS